MSMTVNGELVRMKRSNKRCSAKRAAAGKCLQVAQRPANVAGAKVRPQLEVLLVAVTGDVRSCIERLWTLLDGRRCLYQLQVEEGVAALTGSCSRHAVDAATCWQILAQHVASMLLFRATLWN